MHSLIKSVFEIVGILVISTLLYIAVFGNTGRSLMWDTIEPAIQQNWNMYTFKDGSLITNALDEAFDSVVDISTDNNQRGVQER